jgi:hypothetical protein
MTRTGFPFHPPSLSIDTEKAGEAPDNFGKDRNRGQSD